MNHSVLDSGSRTLLTLLLFLCLCPAVLAQNSRLGGTVSSAQGERLPGVTVTVKGTTTGTTTDASGAFTLNNVGADAVLVVSSIGYLTQEIPTDNRTTLNIILQTDTKALEEVVVVGYGTQSRRNITGSIAKVELRQTENLPNTNVSQALRGRVAGVQFTENGRPGQGGTILIRGQRSISAGNDPLIVLDGIFFNGSLADISPNDIESMEVLKDASSTAIYGARAANGVILITSKRGATEKPVIRLNAFYGVSSWSYKPLLLSPEGYLQRILDFRKQNGQPSDPARIADYITQTEARNLAAGNTVNGWDIISQDASIQSYDLSISGRAGQKTNYFLSGSYLDEKGLIFNDNSKRILVRTNLDNQITNWLRAGVNAQFSVRDLSGNNASVADGFWTSPYSSIWLDEAQTRPNPVPTEDGLVGNPLLSAIVARNLEKNQNLFANFYATVDAPFLPGLSYRVNYSPNYRWTNVNNFQPIYRQSGVNNNGFANKSVTTNFDWVLENIVTYARQFGTKHDLDLTLLYGRNQFYAENTFASGADFTASSDANGWHNLGLGRILASTSSASRIDAVSSMARLNYRYNNRYLFTATARRDGSSVFGANQKFGVFPSAAVAWIASEEPFIQKISAINLLKFRASYGSVGNQAISAYQSLIRQGSTQYVYGDGGATAIGLFPANLANPDLSWETTTTLNLAVDFDLFKGRLGGTVEWYNANTKDLLLTRRLPTPNGFASVLTNVGATNNKGVEITLNTLNLRKNNVEWSSTLIFSSNINRIVNLYRNDLNNDGVEDDDINNRWFIGQPISVAYDYVMDGIYQEGDQIPTGQRAGFVRMADTNGDGRIDPNDRQVLGTLQPKYRWSINNNVRVGNFSLQLNINALQGWLGNNTTIATDNSAGGNGWGNFPGRSANMLDVGYWTAENKSNTRPSLVYTNPLGRGYYQSRDFVRLQEASLAYDLPKSLTNRLKMNSLRVYLSGRNLLTFTQWQGMDPETAPIGSPYFRGDMFPVARTISAGINVSL